MHAFELMQGFNAGHISMPDFMQCVDFMRGFYAEDFMLRKNAYDPTRRQGAADLIAARIPPGHNQN